MMLETNAHFDFWFCPSVDPMPNLVTDRFMGQWYEVMRDSDYQFFSSMYCPVA